MKTFEKIMSLTDEDLQEILSDFHSDLTKFGVPFKIHVRIKGSHKEPEPEEPGVILIQFNTDDGATIVLSSIKHGKNYAYQFYERFYRNVTERDISFLVWKQIQRTIENKPSLKLFRRNLAFACKNFEESLSGYHGEDVYYNNPHIERQINKIEIRRNYSNK